VIAQESGNFFRSTLSTEKLEMSAMILALSLMTLILGTSFACAAPRVPAYAVKFEQWGGTLFVSGLTLLGAVLPRLC
jgi:hypothetical protein